MFEVAVDLHPIEAAWRRFRSRPRHAMLTRALELRQGYLDFIGLDRAPAEVVLPGSVPFNLAVVDEARADGEETGSWISSDGSLLVNTIHV